MEAWYDERMTTLGHMFDFVDGWQEFKDVIPNFLDTSIKSNTLLEHMNMTKAESDYLWYTSRYCHLFENMYHFLLNMDEI